nr:CusA/CzcA family heavy metal efflux RND transporter [Pedobacter sp. ASV19]
MLSKIIEFSVRNKLIIGLFILALVGYGTYQTTQLPIDAVPDITDNQVQVITVAPALGATDIERLVTFPIEQANSNISGIKQIRSFSRFGLSLVTIVFEDDVDVYWARQQVAERMQQIQGQIPQGIGTPTLGPISTGLGEIYQYVVRPKKGYEQKYDATQLRTIQDWIVRRQLLGVKGVAEVSSFGGKLKQYEIAIKPAKLNAYHVTINDVFSALENNNQNTGGAYIEKGPAVLYIRSEGLIGNIEDIGNIALKSNSSGTPLFIRDIADVKIGNAIRYGAMTYNDQGEVSGAVVMMLKGANSSQVVKNVKERVAQIQKTLPEGVEIEAFLDRTKMVNHAISTVEKNLMEGALIVVFVLVVFLGNFRAGLIVASVIPLSMLFAICMMNLFGVSGNLMSMGALDFGLIVDGAVIIVETVMHHLAHNRNFRQLSRLTTQQMDEEVSSSAGKMMNSAVFGQIIILIVYLPIFTLQGIEGKMFRPMAQTVVFALLGAFILSLTYIPMISSLCLSKKIKKHKNLSDRIMERIDRVYQKSLHKILRFPKMVIGAITLLFILSVFILSRLGGEFIPGFEEGDFAVDTRVLTGSNLNTTIEYTQKAARILKSEFPEVEKVVTKIGSGEVPTDPMPMEASDMMVILKDKQEWTSAKSFDELSEKMGKALQAVPGITTSFQYPVQMRFNELMTGARQDVVCKIFGENLDSLASTAAELAKIVNTVEGTQNLYVETVTGIPQVIISYKRPVIAQYNLSIADINKVVNTAFAGQSTGLIFEEEKRFDVVVRLDTSAKKNIEDIKGLLVPAPNGMQIPLEQLANVEIKEGPNQIQREDAKRRIIVGFNVRGRDVQSVVNDLQQKVNGQLKLPTGYFLTYGGSFENLNQAKNRLMIVVPISLILIFLLLYFAFSSIRQSLLIYTAIPLSAIGGILFLFLRGMPFSISAGIGFIALFGIAVLNGIVLIAEFNRLKKSGMTNLHKIVLTGATLRLRPVLMTAVVASFGFIPMALSNGSGAEVQRPLATVVIGGLLIATFLTLFLLPVLYVLVEARVDKNRKPKGLIPVLMLCCMGWGSSYAQSPVSIEQATELAIKNNLTINNERLKSEYAKTMIKTAAALPQTVLSSDLGGINGPYFDTRFGLSQSMNFPTVYSREKSLYNEQWKAAVWSVSVKEAEIRRSVEALFYTYLYVKEKQQLLKTSDSVFLALLQRAKLRLEKGESNVVEKSAFEMQRGAVVLQLKQVEESLTELELQLQLLLNTNLRYVPTGDILDLKSNFIPKAGAFENHPYLQLLSQQKEVARSQTRLEKAKLLPELSLGYANGSFRGVGPDDKMYTANDRFHSLQVGVGIPIFAGSNRAKVKASKQYETIAENTYRLEAEALKNQQEVLIQQLHKNEEMLAYYKLSVLPSAVTITETAGKQFTGGEINYLEYVQLLHQGISAKSNYLEAIKTLNDNIIQLHYLESK